MHAVLDVAAGVAAFWLVRSGPDIWTWLCRGTEAVANSWREWTLGPVRVINHGFYAGLGTVGGLLVALPLAGPDQFGWLAVLILGAIVGAGLWAQIVEGSPQLLRPYGYFGSALAVVIVGTLVGAFGGNAWLVLGAFGVGACVTQAAGRIRCLVQGCCHGRAVSAPWGIRYTHPRSRVVRLAKLGGVPVHPTQLYSILWTLFTGLILLRLWILASPLPLIVGGYFLLIGLGRFVEEHYRGEPQTARFAGLAIYQWLAIAFVVGGAAVTAVAGPPAPPLAPFPLSALPAVMLLGAVTCAAYGVDFPRSQKRFSRLT
jgi:prolipoprotein diacylglyceryltransferase